MPSPDTLTRPATWQEFATLSSCREAWPATMATNPGEKRRANSGLHQVWCPGDGLEAAKLMDSLNAPQPNNGQPEATCTLDDCLTARWSADLGRNHSRAITGVKRCDWPS